VTVAAAAQPVHESDVGPHCRPPQFLPVISAANTSIEIDSPHWHTDCCRSILAAETVICQFPFVSARVAASPPRKQGHSNPISPNGTLVVPVTVIALIAPGAPVRSGTPMTDVTVTVHAISVLSCLQNSAFFQGRPQFAEKGMLSPVDHKNGSNFSSIRLKTIYEKFFKRSFILIAIGVFVNAGALP